MRTSFLVVVAVSALVFTACSSPDDSGRSDAGDLNVSEHDATGNDATGNDVDGGDDCPDEDDGYSYVSEDPDECTSLDINCGPGTERFDHDECGCGCRQLERPDDCPDEEDGYEYASEDPQECAAMDIACEPGKEIFNDECGCGCKLPDCPSEEEGYDYTSQNPDECDDIDIACPGTHEPFSSEYCGCGCRAPGAPCDHWHVWADGSCEEELGWAYDGEECVSLSGCDCVGIDCDLLTSTREECQQRVQGCEE